MLSHKQRYDTGLNKLMFRMVIYICTFKRIILSLIVIVLAIISISYDNMHTHLKTHFLNQLFALSNGILLEQFSAKIRRFQLFTLAISFCAVLFALFSLV